MDALPLIISLAVAVAIGYACYKIAISKGRNGTLFGVLGFLFPIIVLIIIAVLPAKQPGASEPPATG